MTREEEAIQILEKLREKYDDPLKCEYWWAIKEGIKALRFKEGVCEQWRFKEEVCKQCISDGNIKSR